ncbi:hypothetical protein [Streptomyces sp. AK02-01A]|uniref:hypothetical protein n=1 Tax=Streptomyces sp. AK02-01A TaxID=3028648 RepID=UPI0029B4D14D|nr:hypothetical protein [Streptomyces sp. AK02-01A]MDX3849461.1 hypothetical protein [Streptomyces sp. AK02-01A]
MTRDLPRESDEAGSVRHAVMLPGFEGGREEGVPQAFLDAFETENSHAVDADTEGDVVLPAGTDAEHTGRHRQKRHKSRKRPAFVMAAAVGAVLTALPFLSQSGGPGRHETQGRPTPAAAAPDDEAGTGPTEDGVTAEPVALAGAQVRATWEPSGSSPSSHATESRSARTGETGSGLVRSGDTTSGAPAGRDPGTTRPTPRQTPAAPAGTVIAGPHVMRMGAPVRAGAAELSMEPDGNFVVRDGSGIVRWAANTATLGSRAVFQGDGNLVVVADDGTRVWQSGTAGHPGAKMVLQESGLLLIRSASGVLLWSSGPSE